ncbi:hypothetical protein E2562_014919 [Oryza meyeriana var. granulata]|uniref:Uncharacterized protein n=1 Tax=Oryza meyeriana var. granulata TaxID=110450 RepID=A0A6G1ELF6_9ORYZ|nr:hypothetical protein E2562_014919 [Oryza meyeriana var. granulata]
MLQLHALFGVLTALFALSFFLITIFLCLRTLHLGRRQRDRAVFLEEQKQQRMSPPRFGLDAAAIARLPSFPYMRAHGSEASAVWVECPVFHGKAEPPDNIAARIAATSIVVLPHVALSLSSCRSRCWRMC